jgi:hypothetical protein
MRLIALKRELTKLHPIWPMTATNVHDRGLARNFVRWMGLPDVRFEGEGIPVAVKQFRQLAQRRPSSN